ncbi:MAG TPA: hypothetical protein VMV09_05215 [Candidatus Saccharimonadales bacterium]|nr:hypothetical protein [Candidatus Saccharimonadales bacterium]
MRVRPRVAAHRRGVPQVAWAAALYLGLALLWTLPVWLSHGGAVPKVAWGGFASDAGTYLWFLGWIPYAMSHGLFPYYSHWLDYPGGANVAFPGPPLPWMVLMWPVTVVAGVVTAYNLLVVLAIVSSALASWHACRRWVARPLAAVVGGAMFGFSPFVLGQALQGHANLMLVPTIPLCALAFDELLVRQRWSVRRLGLIGGTLLAFQLLTSEEVAAIIVLTAMVATGALAAVYREEVTRRWRYVAGSTAWGLVPVVPALLLLGGAQWLLPGAVHGQVGLGGVRGSPDALSIILPGFGELLTLPAFVKVQLTSNYLPTESLGYVGVPLMLVLAALRRSPDRFARWLVAMVGITVVLMLGPWLQVDGYVTHIPLPGVALAHLPLVDNLLPARMSSMLDWLLALSLAVFTDRRGPRRGEWQRLGLAALAMGLWLPNLGIPVAAVRTPAFFTGSRIPVGSVLMVVPLAQVAQGAVSEVWQAESGMRFMMTGGYYLRVPLGMGGMTPYGPKITPLTRAVLLISVDGTPIAPTLSLRAATRSYLRSHRVAAVVVGPGHHRREEVSLFRGLLGRAPRREEGVDVWSTGIGTHTPPVRLAR